MGLIKEPLNLDFYTDGKEMTDKDQKRVNDYIKRKKTRKKQTGQILKIPARKITNNKVQDAKHRVSTFSSSHSSNPYIFAASFIASNK